MTVKRVLHVDDDPEWREIVQKALAEIEGLKLSSYASIEEAQTAAASNHFDLFVCDGEVGVKDDGWFWAAKLYQYGHNVCVLSAYRDYWTGFAFFNKGQFPEAARDLKDYVRKTLSL